MFFQKKKKVRETNLQAKSRRSQTSLRQPLQLDLCFVSHSSLPQLIAQLSRLVWLILMFVSVSCVFITNRKLRKRKTQARAICEAFSIFPVSKRALTKRETKTKPIFPSGAKFGLNYSSLKRTKSNSELNTEQHLLTNLNQELIYTTHRRLEYKDLNIF